MLVIPLNWIWVSVGIIILSSILNLLLQVRKKDRCLQVFNKTGVCLNLSNGNVVYGLLKTYSNALEIQFVEPYDNGNGIKKDSFLLCGSEYSTIENLCANRFSVNKKKWLIHHGWIVRLYRKVKNLNYLLKDAIKQSVSIFVNLKQNSKLSNSKLMQNSQVQTLGNTVMDKLGSSYEPALEYYLGRLVTVETQHPDGTTTEVYGYLIEYSDNFLCLMQSGYTVGKYLEASSYPSSTKDLWTIKKKNGTVSVTNNSEFPIWIRSGCNATETTWIDQIITNGQTIKLKLDEKYDIIDGFQLKTLDIILSRKNSVVRHAVSS